jgi:O-antigen ligase
MTLQKVLAYIATVSVFLILLTPFVFYTHLFFPFITAKAYYFRVLVELGFCAWLGLAVLNPMYRPKKSWIVWALSVFMLVLLAANLQGINPSYSYWSNFERMEGYVTFLHLFAFFFVLTGVMRTERLWNWFLNSAVAIGVLQVAWAGLQVRGFLAVGLSQDRIDGTLGNATYLAIYAVFTFFIALFCLLRHEDAKHTFALKKYWHIPTVLLGALSVFWFATPQMVSALIKPEQFPFVLLTVVSVGVLIFFISIQKKQERAVFATYWYMLVMILATVAVFWTATRGSLLGLIGGAVLSMILMTFLYPKKKVLRYSGFGVIGLAVIFFLLVTVFKDTALVQNVNALRRVASISMTETTTIARFYNWNTAWQGVQQRPILGYGLGNYGPVFDTYYTAKMWNQEQWFDRVHNVIFDWLIAGGFTGLLSYLSLFVALMYYIWKKDSTFNNAERAVLTGLIAAYCFHNMFVFDNLVSYIYFFILLGYVHVRVTPSSNEQMEASSDQPLPAIIAIALLVAVFPSLVWVTNANSFQQGTELIKALRISDPQKIPEITEHFQNALALDTFGDTETRQQLLSFTARIITAPTVPLEIKQTTAIFAGEQITKEIAEHPNDPKFLAIAGQFLAQTGNLDQAKVLFERAVAVSPKKQFLYQPLIEILFKQDKRAEALALAKEVYAIEPANDVMWRQYVRSALRADDRTLYNALLTEAFATNRADRVIDLVKQNIETDPENVQPYASLAVAYYQAGMTEDAIATLTFIGEKFGKTVPAAKVQADALIKKIQAGEPIQ